jgi:hypothetical protein
VKVATCERCHAVRGNVETSGMIGRKLKRGWGGGRRDLGRRYIRGGRGLGDPEAGALPEDEIALGSELLVGVHRHAPRDTQLTRQVEGRRHPRSGSESFIADRTARLLLDLRAAALRRRAASPRRPRLGLRSAFRVA